MQHPQLFDSILQQNQSGLPEKDYLKQVAKQHPYFTPAQFYVLQQMRDTDAGYDAQAAKTAVLFNNPHWLNFQLQENITATIIEEEIIIAPLVFSVAEPQKELQTSEQLNVVENSDNDDDIAVIEEEIAIEPPVAAIVEAQKEPQTEEQLMLAENVDNDDDGAAIEEEIEPIKITIPNLKQAEINEHTPAFEPMHLVDYFASQGIKLSDEVQTTDKLGKQLKSFTEWLKTMKKVHIPDSEANASISDIAIQALAAKSNKEGEIVTEAMADVLVQQGKAAKAIEVYQKLSLLNPSKSAFFAAKIEQLKGS